VSCGKTWSTFRASNLITREFSPVLKEYNRFSIEMSKIRLVLIWALIFGRFWEVPDKLTTSLKRFDNFPYERQYRGWRSACGYSAGSC
jgi:hypothetical protein